MAVSQGKEWLVLVPDLPNALEQRLRQIPAHMANNKANIEAGKIISELKSGMLDGASLQKCLILGFPLLFGLLDIEMTDRAVPTVSGPTLEEHPPDPTAGPAALKMTGSFFVIIAGDVWEVWQMLRNDPLATGNVWDLGKATVSPFKCGFRKTS